MTQTQSRTKQITEFTFWEFCLAIQKAVKEGFEFAVDNEKFPTAYSGFYNCTMVKSVDYTEELNAIAEAAKQAVQEKQQEIGVEAVVQAFKPSEEQPESIIPEVKELQEKGRKTKAK